MTKPIALECNLHVERRGRGGRKMIRDGQKPSPQPPGRVPRVARLMALAIRYDGLIRAGEVRDYAELARLAHVTRARITQIMNLRLLAPDIQEAILFLPRVDAGRDPIHLRRLQLIALTLDWWTQRKLWSSFFADSVDERRAD